MTGKTKCNIVASLRIPFTFVGQNHLPMTRHFPLATLLIGLFSISCEKNSDPQDTVAPVIQEMLVNGSSGESTASAGGTLVLNATLTDNEALGEFKIDIHDVFDGHNHGKVLSTWTYVAIKPLSGTQMMLIDSIAIPSEAAAGPYHVVGRLLDASGNEAAYVEHELTLTNGSEPLISMSNPDPTMESDWEPGMSYALEGMITDEEGIDEVLITLEETGDHQHGKLAELPLFTGDYDLGGVKSWDLMQDGNVVIAIPADAEHADYTLKIQAKDVAGNYSLVHIAIHIH